MNSSQSESPKEVLRDANRGTSEGTPFIALGGVMVVVAIAVVAVIAICVIAIMFA